ncbi:MAG: tol-pal system-associated acyl-CoA thioesterase [Paracoccus sp. (in: a-proteobacteria)]|nr:tol-pal system-associated acyl-CoA thioesterase [Paracoccus sp. (in: a-proteobacteria)]
MPHCWPVRVYYEDTDLAGIVYYANYLRFIERARTEWIRELGIDQNRLKDEQGAVFAVRRIEADYLSPAKFDDMLIVTTAPARLTPARIELDQQILRDGAVLFAARVTLACLGPDMRPRRLPRDLAAVMAG